MEGGRVLRIFKRMAALSVAAVLAAGTAVPASADAQGVDYVAAYTAAFQEAEQRHQEMDLMEPYNGVSYVYFDMTGDGIRELVFSQVTNKHSSEFWVYSFDGTNLYNLGTVENDADSDAIWGYKGGLLYRESYKGFLTLYQVSFNGGVAEKTELTSLEYDRASDPPSLESLSSYYDPAGVTEHAPEWTELPW